MGIAMSGNPRPREPFENPPISKAAELPIRANIEKESKSDGIYAGLWFEKEKWPVR
jgi:hypothetical protein